MPENKIRFKFVKVGEFKYLSHLDITRFIIRGLARADIRVEYSHGFNPKPKINFSNPTPLGVESLAEYSDIVLAAEYEPDDFLNRLNRHLKSQLKAVQARYIRGKIKSLMADIAVVLYSFKLGTMGDNSFRQALGKEISREGDIGNSIYRIDFAKGEKNFSLLKLYGYAKILKNKNNGIFKYNYFYDYFTNIAKKYSVNIYSVVKEEMFVLRQNTLKLPMEVI
ncbi:MAG: TIGR03936 family radical SAM-associated protein [Actinomycetota bacterium]